MCCIEPSISQAIPNMPNGKKAGEPCANLNLDDYTCNIWGQSNYPRFCGDFKPVQWACGSDQQEASQVLRFLEHDTHPLK